VQLLSLAKAELAAGLTGFELMNAHSLALVAAHFPQLAMPLPLESACYVLLELSDALSEPHAQGLFERLLEHAMHHAIITNAAIAQSLAQSQHFWLIRESIPLAQAEEGLNIKHDISLPISRIAQFVESVGAQLEATFPGSRLVNFGHLGDGNLHFNLQAPRSVDHAAFLAENQERCNALVHDAVHARGGSISAEHGIGQLKAASLAHYKSEIELAMMRSVKQALDPQNLLNPGKVLLK
jgi:FAD/FMN-containing dehydrogenase